MPVKPVAIGIAVVALAFAVWQIIGGIRRHRWLSLLRIPPIFCCLALVALLVSTIFGLNGPHPFFNKPAPVSSGSFIFTEVSPSQGTRTSILIAVSAQTGKTVWQRDMERAAPGFVSDGRTVYTAEFSADSTPTTTYITARNGADGTLLWRIPLPNTSDTSAPVLADGVLYLEAVQGPGPDLVHLLALRAADGGMLWSIDVDDTWLSPFSIYPATGIVYVVSHATPILQARRADSGKLLWSQRNDVSNIVAGPTAVYTFPQEGGITARSAQTGAKLWSFGSGDTLHSAVLSGDALYVSADTGLAHGQASNQETVYALNAATGVLRWRFATQSDAPGGLMAGAGNIYLDAGGDMYALRASDGAALWQYNPHSNLSFANLSPVLGSVLYLTAIEPLPPDTIQLFGPVKGQTYLYAINTADGTAYWGTSVGPVFIIPEHFVV